MNTLHALPATAKQAPVSPAEAAVASLLSALGRSLEGELGRTPQRVAATFAQLLRREDVVASTFPADGYRELVLMQDIPFHSLCEHHLLPFRGVAHVGYLPGDVLVGISTLPRIVEYFARDLQMQERMTMDVASWLEAELEPRGVGVVIEAEQLCMSMRGVGTPETITATSVFLGELAQAGPARAAFELVRSRS
jgi:GTP cyclohydrolase I